MCILQIILHILQNANCEGLLRHSSQYVLCVWNDLKNIFSLMQKTTHTHTHNLECLALRSIYQEKERKNTRKTDKRDFKKLCMAKLNDTHL